MGAKSKGSESVLRTITVHREGCEAAARSQQAVIHPASPVNTELDPTFHDGAYARYELAVRPVYGHLRRVIGQVSGLIILYRMDVGSDLRDLPEVADLYERLACVDDALASLSVPKPLAPHARRLLLAHRSCRTAATELRKIACGGSSAARLDRAGDSIELAYSALRSASDDRAGLFMVDFSHACCSCSTIPTPRTGNRQ